MSDVDSSIKLSNATRGTTDTSPHDYGRIWEREDADWGSRLVIAASRDQLDLPLGLAVLLPNPHGLLWVLAAPRSQAEAGRYQSPEFEDFTALCDMLERYRGFIEGDGRHHLWIMNTEGQGQLILDNHNLIYAYGPIEEYTDVLSVKGYTEGRVRIPYPHAHHYHDEHDRAEVDMLSSHVWQRFDLVEEHDDP